MVSPLKTDLAGPRIDKGLDDIYVKETSICFVDGQRGRLLYRGYDIRDLAAHSTFEETVFLLLEGHLPNREELEKAKADLAKARTLPPSVLRLLRSMPEHAPPMDVLRTAVSYMSSFDPERDNMTRAANMRKARRLVAQFGPIGATHERIRKGQRIVRPEARGGIRPEHPADQSEGLRVRPPRLQDVPPAGAQPQGLRPSPRGDERGRHVLPDRDRNRGHGRATARLQTDLPERGLLRRTGLPRPRDPDRPFHNGLRDRPDRRMDGPGHRVLGGQSPPAAARLVRGPERPRLRAPRRAILRRPACRWNASSSGPRRRATRS